MSEYIDNATQRRREQLKEIIRQLHEGKSVEQVKLAFAELLEDVGPDEIVEIEEALVEEGLDPEEIQPLCDVHVAVFRDALDSQRAPETIPGHPIFTYRAENLGVKRVLEEVSQAVDAYATAPGPITREAARAAVSKLMQYDKHYLRKENLLFPYLERTGFSGPAKVMWGVHNQIRDMWKELESALTARAFEEEYEGAKEKLSAELRDVFGSLDNAIREMTYKEEHILFPAALQRLNEADWAAIRDQGVEIGYCYARPGTQWVPGMGMGAQELSPAEAHGGAEGGNAGTARPAGEIPLNTGALTAEQIDLMLTSLPVDVTFVDENDEVRYFTRGRERIFQRSPAIIGRKVQNCHPPQSVDKVQEILDDFRAGERDVAEFWIDFAPRGAGEMFVHIRYFALRDEAGAYRGTIEVTQNLSPLRALEGEKRLLDS
ncbi:MAG: DUF438 domain-containing protein [Anaerolineae bacterium]